MYKIQTGRLNSPTKYVVQRVRSTKLYSEEELMKLPKLVSVDIGKIDEFGGGKIKIGRKHLYVAKVGYGYYLGHFERRLSGLVFVEQSNHSHWFLARNVKHNQWRKLWKFVYLKPRKK